MNERTKPRAYGSWAGNEKGTPENVTRCVKSVNPPGKWGMISHQCTRKRGHGPDRLYCKQHGAKV